MFRRLILEHWMSLFTLVAFCTAFSVYLTIGWRALRMPREQRERFSRLPLND